MLRDLIEFWQLAGIIALLAGAIASSAVTIWLARRLERFGPAGTAIAVALVLTACWCLTVAALGESTLATNIAETVRNIAWLIAIYRLFASDGRHASQAPIRPVVIVLAAVESLQLVIAMALGGDGFAGASATTAFELSVLFRLLVAVGALVLVHNLYAGASGQSRAALRWPAGGLALLWAFDLNVYTLAYLGSAWPSDVAASRGVAVLVLACLLAIGASRDRDALRIRPSRAVTFQTFSLMVIGAYLMAMFSLMEWLSYSGGDMARLMELALLTLASVLALFVLPSKRLRGWLKVTLAKHLFQHRYDYRAEWLRFTQTIGNSGDPASSLGERVVKALADIAESPAGLLLAPGDHGELTLAARWQWPEIEVPGSAISATSAAYFEKEGFIADLDELRAGSRTARAHVPDWLRRHPRAWALVPLIHFDRLVGMVVLARPPAPRKLDWEDFDLLRVVGSQLASYLAEHSSQEALAEANRFDDFNRRIAFVMHDVKNLASQLSLLARNAERHADKPAFRDDMLVTLRNAAEKLNILLARLSRYGSGVVERNEEVDAAKLVRSVVGRFQNSHPVVLAECQHCVVTASRDSLEQVLVHLIQNAVDASSPQATVYLSLTSNGMNACFEIVDSGCGMSPEFVRTKLFKPFISTKSGGFGIGAFEARELVRGMRGRLEVESREGLGTRFVVRLPLVAAVGLLQHMAGHNQKVAS